MAAGGLGGFLAAVLRERGERNREAAEAVPAAPRPILLPEADDPFDPADGDAVIEHFADLAFISYRNAKGEHSYRRITIRGIQPKAGGDLRINAWCHERDAMRTFLASSMLELTDLATGEIHADPTTFLRRHILFDPGTGAPSLMRAAIRQHRPDLILFSYTARCDGRLDPREEAAISRWLSSKVRGSLDPTDVAAHLRRLRPTLIDFTDSLQVLLAGSGDARAAEIAEAVADIILADERVSDEERTMFETLREAFAGAGYNLKMTRH